MVALLVEQRRTDEAAVLLQQGLALDPANSGFAILLARIMVDRQDNAAALAVLQDPARVNTPRADYQAFRAALRQRLPDQAAEADAYQVALRIAPQSPLWWVGLGISEEALGRPKEAQDAYRHARASGTLQPEVAAYVDDRLRQTQ